MFHDADAPDEKRYGGNRREEPRDSRRRRALRRHSRGRVAHLEIALAIAADSVALTQKRFDLHLGDSHGLIGNGLDENVSDRFAINFAGAAHQA